MTSTDSSERTALSIVMLLAAKVHCATIMSSDARCGFWERDDRRPGLRTMAGSPRRRTVRRRARAVKARALSERCGRSMDSDAGHRAPAGWRPPSSESKCKSHGASPVSRSFDILGSPIGELQPGMSLYSAPTRRSSGSFCSDDGCRPLDEREQDSGPSSTLADAPTERVAEIRARRVADERIRDGANPKTPSKSRLLRSTPTVSSNRLCTAYRVGRRKLTSGSVSRGEGPLLHGKTPEAGRRACFVLEERSPPNCHRPPVARPRRPPVRTTRRSVWT